MQKERLEDVQSVLIKTIYQLIEKNGWEEYDNNGIHISRSHNRTDSRSDEFRKCTERRESEEERIPEFNLRGRRDIPRIHCQA